MRSILALCLAKLRVTIAANVRKARPLGCSAEGYIADVHCGTTGTATGRQTQMSLSNTGVTFNLKLNTTLLAILPVGSPCLEGKIQGTVQSEYHRILLVVEPTGGPGYVLK